VGVVGLAWWATRSGRVVSDEEVRPVYASLLAERLRLEQEIDATRVAQQRLIPSEFPRLPGLSSAAACLPARDVAGDFYDVYALRDGRLAVLLAEGGGQRLARALSIALVKGYLMQKVNSAESPGEMLRDLHLAAGRLVEGSTNGLCLAVIDPRELTLRYARTGEWPALLLRRTADSPALPCAEAESSFFGLHIFEGAATLEPGSLILLYTDGVGRRGSLVRALRRGRFERGTQSLDASAVLNSVLARISKRARKKLDDDVTLVAVRLDAISAARQENVA
jgi:serine phosphatase RsbU (regulator of sigma subunit)